MTKREFIEKEIGKINIIKRYNEPEIVTCRLYAIEICMEKYAEQELAASLEGRLLSDVPSEFEVQMKRLRQIVPQHPNAITWENGVEILNFVQDVILPEWEKERGMSG